MIARVDYVFSGGDIRLEVSAIDDRGEVVAFGSSEDVPQAIDLAVADAVRRGSLDALPYLTALQETCRRDLPARASS